MNTLDDAALIVKFVQREGVLTSNQSLRIEPAFDSVQLLAKRGGLLATIKTAKGIATASLRRNSEYWNLINQILADHGYVPTNPSEKSVFIQYEQRRIPEGYKLNCTEARFLWKEWWTQVRQSNRSAIQTDLLIFCRNTWYPVRDIVCTQGMLYITTLVSEFTCPGSELVAWLSKETSQSAELQPAKSASHEQLSSMGKQNKPAFWQTPGRIAFADRNPQPAALPDTPKPLNNPERVGNTVMRPDLRDVLKFRQGKLFITTSIGEVVVEGSNLKFWLDDESELAAKTVNINTYRDREVQAVNH